MTEPVRCSNLIEAETRQDDRISARRFRVSSACAHKLILRLPWGTNQIEQKSERKGEGLGVLEVLNKRKSEQEKCRNWHSGSSLDGSLPIWAINSMDQAQPWPRTKMESTKEAVWPPTDSPREVRLCWENVTFLPDMSMLILASGSSGRPRMRWWVQTRGRLCQIALAFPNGLPDIRD